LKLESTRLACSLLDALYAFYLEHEYCGELDSAVDASRPRAPCGTRVSHALGA
jgi:hypothetical protein